MSLLFRVAELQRELRSLEAIARRHLARGHEARLTELADHLGRMRRRTGHQFPWGWPADNPLLLKPNRGAHGHGTKSIAAAIDSKWSLEVVDQATVRTCGSASVRVHFDSSPREMWRMELGAASAPGCYFHVQIRGQSDEPPWPRPVDIPRFPTLLPTPASVVEFVVAELHQGQWIRDLERNRNDVGVWLGVQRRWWEAKLRWEQSVVDKAEASPWASLKSAVPDVDLLSRDG